MTYFIFLSVDSNLSRICFNFNFQFSDIYLYKKVRQLIYFLCSCFSLDPESGIQDPVSRIRYPRSGMEKITIRDPGKTFRIHIIVAWHMEFFFTATVNVSMNSSLIRRYKSQVSLIRKSWKHGTNRFVWKFQWLHLGYNISLSMSIHGWRISHCQRYCWVMINEVYCIVYPSYCSDLLPVSPPPPPSEVSFFYSSRVHSAVNGGRCNFSISNTLTVALQIILDLCIPEKELAKTRSQI